MRTNSHSLRMIELVRAENSNARIESDVDAVMLSGMLHKPTEQSTAVTAKPRVLDNDKIVNVQSAATIKSPAEPKRGDRCQFSLVRRKQSNDLQAFGSGKVQSILCVAAWNFIEFGKQGYSNGQNTGVVNEFNRVAVQVSAHRNSSSALGGQTPVAVV